MDFGRKKWIFGRKLIWREIGEFWKKNVDFWTKKVDFRRNPQFQEKEKMAIFRRVKK